MITKFIYKCNIAHQSLDDNLRMKGTKNSRICSLGNLVATFSKDFTACIYIYLLIYYH